MRDFDEMKLARVIDACGGINGRVKMQKIVYLLQAMGYDLPFHDFRILQHGPFSREVACSADILTGPVLDEAQEPLGEDMVQYSYTVRENMRELIRTSFPILEPQGRPTVDEAGQELNKHVRSVLEVAATRVYLEREDKSSGAVLEKELKRLKGHLKEHFDDADKLLAELRQKGWLNPLAGD